jgi:tetratricopeptide (TPR) repeat protein
MGYGDTEKAFRMIEDGIQFAGEQRMLAYRFEVDVWTRRFQDILDAVEPYPGFDYYYFCQGIAYWLMEQKDEAKNNFDSARVKYEYRIQTAPQNIPNYMNLGLAYAGLGLKEKAIQIAQKAVELEPISKNAINGPARHKRLSYVYLMVGEYDKALDEIELLLSVPYYYTTWDLKLNPVWDPMRDHPRFQELIVKYSSESK